jgi:hypothetical protein
MTRDRLWLALAILLPALAATLAPLSSVELAYQVRAGDLMLASRAVLATDPFTFTAQGDPWLHQQWGASVLLALVHGLAGWGGLVVLRVALFATTVGLVLVATRRWLPARPAALLALVGFIVASPSLGLRAALFGILLFAAIVAILAWRDRRPAAVWLVPVLVLAWANLHGSFFLGPAAVALALVDDLVARRPDVRRLAIVLALAVVASCLTPFGPGVWSYALGFATNGEYARLVPEWQRTSPLSMSGALFYLSVAGGVVVLVAARRGGVFPRWPALASIAALAIVGAYAERGVAAWAVGAPAALAPIVAALGEGAEVVPAAEPRGRRRLNALAVGLLVVAVAGLQPIWRSGDAKAGPEGLLRDAPTGLAAALADLAGPTDRAVVPQRWASWFEWAAPGVPLLVDSRVEVVPAAAWIDYATIAAGGEKALVALQGNTVTVVVVDAALQSALGIALRTPGAGWRLGYEDADGQVFVRAP